MKHDRTRLVVAAAVCALALTLTDARADENKAVFTLIVNNVASTYDTTALFALPGERVPIEARGRSGATYAIRAKDGEVTPTAPNRWTWRAPAKPGAYKLEVIDATPDAAKRATRMPGAEGDESVKLNAFVMVPATLVRNGILNGYHIGSYPDGVFRDNPIYKAPRGFVEITKDTEDVHVSPHFTVGQFLCKQADAYPKYLVLDERLPVKLEEVIERLQALGYTVKGLTVMSGYRTPYYNRALGNVKFSVHQFGGAADVFVDADRNGNMDDLNKDGRVDQRDAVKLYDIIDRLTHETGVLQGGLGNYPATRAHGPFVHVDVRGNAARWAE